VFVYCIHDVFCHREPAGKDLVDIDLERVVDRDVVDWTTENVQRRRERNHRKYEHGHETVNDVFDYDVFEDHREDVDVLRNTAEQHESSYPSEKEDDGGNSIVDWVAFPAAVSMEPDKQRHWVSTCRQPVYRIQK